MKRAAVVGTGFIAHTHIRILKEQNIDVVLAVGYTLRDVETFAERYGIPNAADRFEDIYHFMPDCVHICTPPALHYEQVRNLLTHGINVVCEKPLCLTSAEAADLVRIAEENHLRHAVGFNVRYHRGVEEMRRMIKNNEPGQLYLVHGTYLQEFHMMPCPMGWRYQSETAGPMRAVTEIGSHWLDLFEYVSGQKISEVNASFINTEKKRGIRDGMLVKAEEGTEIIQVDSEDAALIHFRTEAGLYGSVVLSEISAGRVNYLSMEFCGSERTVRWNSEEPNTVYTGLQNKGTVRQTYPFDGGFEDTQRRLFKAFYDDLENNDGSTEKAYPTMRDGLRNILLCEAIYRSASGRKWEKIGGNI